MALQALSRVSLRLVLGKPLPGIDALALVVLVLSRPYLWRASALGPVTSVPRVRTSEDIRSITGF